MLFSQQSQELSIRDCGVQLVCALIQTLYQQHYVATILFISTMLSILSRQHILTCSNMFLSGLRRQQYKHNQPGLIKYDPTLQSPFVILLSVISCHHNRGCRLFVSNLSKTSFQQSFVISRVTNSGSEENCFISFLFTNAGNSLTNSCINQ